MKVTLTVKYENQCEKKNRTITTTRRRKEKKKKESTFLRFIPFPFYNLIFYNNK